MREWNIKLFCRFQLQIAPNAIFFERLKWHFAVGTACLFAAYIYLHLFFNFYKGVLFVVRAREGGASTTSFFLAAHFAKRNTKFGGGGKARAGKNSFPPTPFLFARPSVRFGSCRAKRGNQKFFSKNVWAELYHSSAGYENRTRASCLGSKRTTIIRIPHTSI